VSFEDRAETWIAWARHPWDSYWFFRYEFFELLPSAPQKTLEVGCGEGRVARDLAEREYQVTALDASPTLVNAARAAHPDGEYTVGPAEALPFDDGSFNLVVAYNSLMDVDEMPRAVAEIARVLRPGGALCACITHPMIDSGRWAEDNKTYLIEDVYVDRRRYHGTFERPGLAPMTFDGWIYPLEAYSRALEEAGLLIEALREPVASDEFVTSRPVESRARVARWQRLPNFLMFRAAKPPTPRP
jgi:SAM-dependent methyltransferase